MPGVTTVLVRARMAAKTGLTQDQGVIDFYTLAIDPNTPATIYAASYVQGVFKSTDQAAKTGQPSMQD